MIKILNLRGKHKVRDCQHLPRTAAVSQESPGEAEYPGVVAPWARTSFCCFQARPQRVGTPPAAPWADSLPSLGLGLSGRREVNLSCDALDSWVFNTFSLMIKRCSYECNGERPGISGKRLTTGSSKSTPEGLVAPYLLGGSELPMVF